MTESIGVMLRLLLEVFAGVAIREPSALAFAAAAVAAVAVLAITLTLVELPVSATGSSPHPLRAIDVSVRLTQSHPDAPGHSRPRAPGAAASAA
ncbi:UNVERIFIED_CONTAM: DUF6412 domain-containing protein [Microbacterium sp. SLM126]|uniref:DUF6412 domain-containing protein n=1 Tax=Microbacterium sp. Root180 TaxID=1736483 RepID=UPI0006F59B65|nr:DUF6412 domain-containing protein [Microbacterium sp. Root180]KRB38423.1 hypothetical protein ASD93_00150 [Microbacterium sp. Root180]